MHMKHTNTKPSRKALLAQIHAELLLKASLLLNVKIKQNKEQPKPPQYSVV